METTRLSVLQSESINELAMALSKAQGEYGIVTLNRENPYFKSRYADLDAILRAVRPAFANHGLSFYQYTSLQDGAGVLHSRILHSSGQWIESQVKINPPKNDIQSYGSTMSYMKRYSAMSLVGITTSEDVSDDDASFVATAKEFKNSKISTEQLDSLEDAIGNREYLKNVICSKFGIDLLENMSAKDYSTVMKIVQKVSPEHDEGA